MNDQSGYVLVQKDSEVALLTLNRPEKANAFTKGGRDMLVAELKKLQDDDGVKVAIITGAGRFFCAGADVVTQRGEASVVSSKREQFVEPIAQWILDIYQFGKPLIAAVNGVAAGAGFSIALACDIRIASESARFAAAWVDRGLVPDAGCSFFLPRLIGLSRSTELAFTGQVVDAHAAERIGLVNKVVKETDLIPTARELALSIASKPPITVALIKRTLRLGADTPLERQIHNESYSQRMCGLTEDGKEAMAAFREKRKPVFKGR